MRLAIALAVLAASPAAATEVVRLSDAQREAVIAAAANGPEKEPVLTPEQAQRQSVLNRSLYPEFYGQQAGGPGARDRKVHGEMSMFAGSGGTVGYSGTAILPVGQNGSAAISVTQGTSRYGGFQNFAFGFSSGGSNAFGVSGSFGNPYGYGYPYGFGSPFGFGGPGHFRPHW